MIAEEETAALRAWLGHSEVLSSAVVLTEVSRAVRRRVGMRREPELAAVLGSLRLLPVDAALLRAAADLLPRELRSLDAVHLASAHKVAAVLDAFVCYDLRLADAARAAGHTVAAPA